MQRTENNLVILSCDFCGKDWDEVIPMIEGHRGSIICLDCLEKALQQATSSDTQYDCTMCLQEKPGKLKHWRNSTPVSIEGLNPHAVICWDDIRQAAKAFHKDKEIDFSWNPAHYPKQDL